MKYDPDTATFTDEPCPHELHKWEDEGGFASDDLELHDRFEQVQGD